MAKLRVEVEHDHLERLIKGPLPGLAELIWNAIDADADVIDCNLEFGPFCGPELLVVTDTGTGITAEQASLYFSHLGGSWKKAAIKSAGGRPLHGQAGQGRWSAYGIGSSIAWTSVAEQVTGGHARIRITGSRDALKEFDVSDPEPTDEPTGTTVRVGALTDKAQATLGRNDVVEFLTTTFALRLEQHPIKIRWRGTTLDPQSIQGQRYDEPLVVEGIPGELRLVIIEWKIPQKNRTLHLCDEDGASLAETRPGIHAPGFDFTAYIRWDGFRTNVSDIMLGQLDEESDAARIVEAAKSDMRAYFKKRAGDRASELITTWKADSTYPFTAEPATTVERAERELFDIVAVAAAPAVSEADTKTRRLSFRLMREALESNPESLHAVLREVLDLPEDHLHELREMLRTTSLSAIIAATRRITDRLNFLAALEALVFDTDVRGVVRERAHLHRILAAETWVFREEYALTADDESLRTALRQHIGVLGRDDLVPAEVESADVLDSDGARTIVDMMLSRVVEQRQNQREHIVIELKRPTVHIGMEQVTQITKYAQAVASDARFSQTNTKWEFWIVGDKIDPSAELLVRQRGRERGVFADDDTLNVVCRAVTWADVLQDARHRLQFVRESLAYESTRDAGFEYLRTHHAERLPAAVLEP